MLNNIAILFVFHFSINTATLIYWSVLRVYFEVDNSFWSFCPMVSGLGWDFSPPVSGKGMYFMEFWSVFRVGK